MLRYTQDKTNFKQEDEMEKREKLGSLNHAKVLLLEALELCEEALEGDINAEAYFLSSLRELAGVEGNPYNQTINTMIERVEESR